MRFSFSSLSSIDYVGRVTLNRRRNVVFDRVNGQRSIVFGCAYFDGHILFDVIRARFGRKAELKAQHKPLVGKQIDCAGVCGVAFDKAEVCGGLFRFQIPSNRASSA